MQPARESFIDLQPLDHLVMTGLTCGGDVSKGFVYPHAHHSHLSPHPWLFLLSTAEEEGGEDTAKYPRAQQSYRPAALAAGHIRLGTLLWCVVPFAKLRLLLPTAASNKT